MARRRELPPEPAETIARGAVVEAINVLGLDPSRTRAVTLTLDAVEVDEIRMDENGVYFDPDTEDLQYVRRAFLIDPPMNFQQG